MAEQTERNVVAYHARDGVEVKLSPEVVKKYLVSGRGELVTDQELMLFMGMCKARGLNPFKRDCYLIKYTEKESAQIVTSIDYFRSRAKAQADCRGWKSGIIIATSEKTFEYREGAMMIEGEDLVGGWFKAQPEGWTEPMTWAVSLAPYIKKRSDGQITAFWKPENQPYMIAKVAESQGLRRVWPDEFQGLAIEGDEVIDVTEKAPLQKPRSIHESKAIPESKPADTKPSGDDHPASTAGNGSEKAKKETKANTIDPLEWIEKSTEQEFLDAGKDWVNAQIKGKSQNEQLHIVSAWNARNKKIEAELEAASKSNA